MANVTANKATERNFYSKYSFSVGACSGKFARFNKLCQHDVALCDLHWDIDVNIKAQLEAITFARLARTRVALYIKSLESSRSNQVAHNRPFLARMTVEMSTHDRIGSKLTNRDDLIQLIISFDERRSFLFHQNYDVHFMKFHNSHLNWHHTMNMNLQLNKVSGESMRERKKTFPFENWGLLFFLNRIVQLIIFSWKKTHTHSSCPSKWWLVSFFVVHSSPFISNKFQF